MLRMQLPEVWIACISTVARSARMSGTRGSSGQLNWMFWRVEMAVALVVGARHVRQHPHLVRREQAIGDADPQHRSEALDVQAVAQPQRPELVLRQASREEALRLVAELGDPLVDEGLVVLVVAVHRS